MKSTSEFCMIPGAYGFKFPKLAELYYILFGREFTEAHDASLDVRITAKCFWALMNKGFYSNISSLEKNKSKWGSNIPNRSELLSSELFTSNWKKWEFSQLLPVKTISKNLVFIYFENGLVTTDKHLFDDNVFDHPTVFDDLVIEQIFDEGGLGIWLKGEKSEYMVNSEGITFWRRAETGENDKSLRIVSFSSNTKIVTFNNTLKTTKEHLIEKRDIIFTFKNKVLEPINPYYHTYEYIKVKQGFKGYTNKEGLTFWFRE